MLSIKKAIVIGSGFGGLAIASRLKYRGYDVKLLEKQADLGGRAQALSSNGFVYDAGPTVITAPYLGSYLSYMMKRVLITSN